jgi:hypothetical protein
VSETLGEGKIDHWQRLVNKGEFVQHGLRVDTDCSKHTVGKLLAKLGEEQGAEACTSATYGTRFG